MLTGAQNVYWRFANLYQLAPGEVPEECVVSLAEDLEPGHPAGLCGHLSALPTR